MTDFEQTDADDDNIALAGEYVMGILSREQQKAVQESLGSNPLLKHWVHYWEAQLSQLYTKIPTKQPPQKIWKQIKQQIQPDIAQRYSWQKMPWWQGMIFWRGLALASIIGLVSLTVMLRLEWLPSPSPLVTLVEQPPVLAETPSYIAVVRDNKNQAFWHISLHLAAKNIWVTPLKSMDLPTDKSYELWLLSKDKDTPPRSMGLMPTQGSEQLMLSLNKALLQAKGLAVSLEPLGGSPLETPSGPVIFQAKLEQLI